MIRIFAATLAFFLFAGAAEAQQQVIEVSASRSLATTDCGNALYIDAAITLTLPSGLTCTSPIDITNGYYGQATILSGFPPAPVTAFPLFIAPDPSAGCPAGQSFLYPGQHAQIAEVGTTWQASQPPLSWNAKQAINSLTYGIYVNPSSGNDCNDGMTAATAFKHLQYAINFINNHILLTSVASIFLAPGTYTENVVYAGDQVGGRLLNVYGSGVGSTVLNGTFLDTDGAIISLGHMTVTGFVTVIQHSVLDVPTSSLSAGCGRDGTSNVNGGPC
jgi:hypothetical protein